MKEIKTTKNIQAVRGMSDILPAQIGLWQKLEAVIRELTHSYAYQEIRTPIVESTALFLLRQLVKQPILSLKRCIPLLIAMVIA